MATKQPSLPADIKASDLVRPNFTDETDPLARIKTGEREWEYEPAQFEMWFTEQMGWCIPTLLIARASRGSSTDRTYATTLDGKQVRIGKGPHVKRVVTVYVRQSRLAALQHYLDLRHSGAETSNQIRDRISSRRAQGQVMRQQGRTSWRWDI